jgi:glucose/arabinose dehydrogenase
VADPNSETIIFSVAQPYVNHNGGDLHFGPDGYLYIGMGDGGDTGDPQNRSQTMTVPFGKMLRINVNSGSPYSIPSTNPFATSPTAMHEIWANGFRNPWRFSFDRQTGDLWVGDVGQGLWEEIDRWPAGNNTGPNFGWRCYEGNATYNSTGCLPASNYVFPLNVQPHSAGWCAIVGGYVYRGPNYSRLTGRYIYTDWCSGVFLSLQQNGATWLLDTLLESGVMGYAAMGEDLNGEIYVADQGAGGIYRITDPYASVRVSVKAFLEGPFVSASDQMSDGLRTAGLVPLNEPYTDLGFVQHGSGHESTTPAVLAVTGNNAIVDWVRIELRQNGAPTNIVATANALIQRDGDVVATDGVSPVTLIALPGSYYVAIRHRHHLGCMTAGTVALSATSTTIDFRTTSTTTYGTAARKTIGSRQVLWAGNARSDNVLRYTGTNNDRDPILVAIGGVVPTNTISGYLPTDLNMDGTVKYTGTGNDRDLILQNIGGVVPTNTRTEQLP